ncbi:vWA domain-containing protein [Leucobacter triazinivorans]|uniref:VWA domain-containing protein n=1 Tax=Leucobacter triazinivorans TaxID=1784719 RepID=A0A4V0Z177_9MICO|nr:vWA domain-containing protein [Leucobacter triazinivorans]QBE47449.1 VWA domain-containing protein [Leucobacter triazinivorans]
MEAREGLQAAGALLGIAVTVTDDPAWELVRPDGRPAELRVGLGWYAARGHGPEEAVALALLQLWESVRGETRAPDRARRARSVVTARPESEPLVAAVVRLQAAAELLVAMPGLRPSLASALERSVPNEVLEQPRHLQWVTVLLRAGLGCDTASAGADAAEEWRGLQRLGAGDFDPLRRVLAPDPQRRPLERFERALALLLPPYERLLALDARERGLGEAPDGATAQEHEGGAETEDFGAAGAGADAEPGAERAEAEGGDAVPPGADESRARPGEGRQTAEGSDLFAAEQAGFVSAYLATPLPAEGALVQALVELDAASEAAGSRREEQRDDDRTAAGAAGSGAALAAAEYRARAAELTPAIERMREVWARVIAERVARVRTIGRRAVPEGETLDPQSLAGAFAEARSGVQRPAAFLRRETRPRRTRRAGSTDYVVLVDRSASMQGRPAAAAADATLVMLEALAGAERDIAHAEERQGIELDLDIRTALVLFDAETQLVKPLSRGLDDTVRLDMVAGIRSPRGSTNDGAALRLAAEQLGLLGGSTGDGRERRRVVIVVSDGGSNDEAASAREMLRLRSAGVGVHGIGIGSDEVVRRYAPSSSRVDDPREIAEAMQRLVESELP